MLHLVRQLGDDVSAYRYAATSVHCYSLFQWQRVIARRLILGFFDGTFCTTSYGISECGRRVRTVFWVWEDDTEVGLADVLACLLQKP